LKEVSLKYSNLVFENSVDEALLELNLPREAK